MLWLPHPLKPQDIAVIKENKKFKKKIKKVLTFPMRFGILIERLSEKALKKALGQSGVHLVN